MHQFCILLRHPITSVILVGRERTSCLPDNRSLKTILQESDTGIVLSRILVGSSARVFPRNKASISNNHPIVQQCLEYLNGDRKHFSGFELDLENQTDFSLAVLNAAAKIPYGVQVSYSELAASAGFPLAVRAAASVMRNNRFPIVIPCHRIISKSGKYGAYCGSGSGEDADLKAALIALESKLPLVTNG